MFDYIQNNKAKYYKLLTEHLSLTLSALSIAVVLGLVVVFLVYRRRRLASLITNFSTSLRVIPSIVLMLVFMPWLGTGRLPALVSLTLIGLPLVLGHSITGLISINPETIEAAKATGMSDFQIFYDIRIPLALPSIITGIRFASLSIAAGAPIAAYIGAGGIGSILFEGMRHTSYIKLFTGSLLVIFLNLMLNTSMLKLENYVNRNLYQEII